MQPKNKKKIPQAKLWQEETQKLGEILLSCGLTEEIKWGKPCYTFKNHNVVVVQGFKKYIALLFMKGVLIDDHKGVLIKTGENTHVGRQIRFTSVAEIVAMKSVLKTYIHKAIAVEKAGTKVDPKEREELVYPSEFKKILLEMPDLKEAFEALTPGRQRAYIFYFSAPKQSKTRVSRIEKSIDQILDGIGINDDYINKAK